MKGALGKSLLGSAFPRLMPPTVARLFLTTKGVIILRWSRRRPVFTPVNNLSKGIASTMQVEQQGRKQGLSTDQEGLPLFRGSQQNSSNEGRGHPLPSPQLHGPHGGPDVIFCTTDSGPHPKSKEGGDDIHMSPNGPRLR